MLLIECDYVLYKSHAAYYFVIADLLYVCGGGCMHETRKTKWIGMGVFWYIDTRLYSSWSSNVVYQMPFNNLQSLPEPRYEDALHWNKVLIMY